MLLFFTLSFQQCSKQSVDTEMIETCLKSTLTYSKMQCKQTFSVYVHGWSTHTWMRNHAGGSVGSPSAPAEVDIGLLLAS